MYLADVFAIVELDGERTDLNLPHKLRLCV
jgi:hypothetical protein